jgi:hypothetical protein
LVISKVPWLPQLPCFAFSSSCHPSVLELSRAHQEGKAATIGDPSRVGKRG